MSSEAVSTVPEDVTPAPVAVVETPTESQEEAPAENKEITEKPAKENGFQKAIDRQTRKLYEQKGRADALEAELNRIRNGNPGSNTSADAEDPAETEEARILRKAGEIARAEIAKTRQDENKTKLQTKWDADAKEMRQADPEFDDLYNDFVRSPNLTPAVDQAILDSDRPAAITHYLATNEEHAAKIAGMSPYRAAIEIGKIEEKLTAKVSPKKVSGAPAPIAPIGAKGGTGEIDPEKESPEEYARRRNKERAAQGKR